MSDFSAKFLPGGLQSIDSATFTGNYQKLGTPLTHPARVLRFANLSNVDVIVSWDGITDDEVVPNAGSFIIDGCANKGSSVVLEIPAQTQFYAKGDPNILNAGSFYMSTYYAG